MNAYAGTATLVRLALRRDRILIPFGILGTIVTIAGSAKATLDLYPVGSPNLAGYAALYATPAAKALYGTAADPSSVDSLAVVKAQIVCMIVLVVVAFAVVRRHTRQDEESGRQELIGAGAVGRRAPLAAAVAIGSTTVLLTAIGSALALVGCGLAVTGSAALGLGWVGLGMNTVAITALAAQLTGSSRVAGGIVATILGAGYLLRVVADISAPLSWLRWLSPFGWNEAVSAYGADRFWVLIVPLLVTACLLAAAFAALDRRDLGAGLLPDRPGPARAAGNLTSALGLAWRLQRGVLLGWGAGVALMAAVAGSLANSVTDSLDDPKTVELLQKMGGSASSLTDTFFSTFVRFVAIAAAAYGVLALLRLHSEEDAGRTEPILAAAVSRTRLMAGHALIALAGTVGMTLAGGLIMAIVSAATMHRPGQFPTLVWAAAATLPASLVVVAVSAVLIGWTPRWALAAWAAFSAAFFLAEFGRVLNIPNPVVEASPWSHTPSLPGGEMTWTSTFVLAALLAVLLVAGDVGFRRRDIR